MPTYVDRLMGQNPRTGRWGLSLEANIHQAWQAPGLLLVRESPPGPSIAPAGAIVTLSSPSTARQPKQDKLSKPPLIVACHARTRRAVRSYALHHHVPPSCSVAVVHILSRFTCPIHQGCYQCRQFAPSSLLPAVRTQIARLGVRTGLCLFVDAAVALAPTTSTPDYRPVQGPAYIIILVALQFADSQYCVQLYILPTRSLDHSLVPSAGDLPHSRR